MGEPRWWARSISRPAHALLRHQPFVAQVLAVFERVLDLVTPAGEVLALVAPEVGDGPLNVVVEAGTAGQAGTSLWAGIEAGLAAQVEGPCLSVGPAIVLLDGAVVWEPCPDWGALRARRETAAHRIAEIEALLPRAQQGWEEHLALLRAGWEGDGSALRRAAAGLAGRGVGLTPAGDDFLCGAMLGAWLLHPDPPAFCRAIVEEAAPRTTTLSAASLRAAGRGECSAAWASTP